MPERLPLILILPWRRDVAAPPFATSISSSSFVSRESDNEMNHAAPVHSTCGARSAAPGIARTIGDVQYYYITGFPWPLLWPHEIRKSEGEVVV